MRITSIEVVYYSNTKPKFQYAIMVIEHRNEFTAVYISKHDISRIIKRLIKRPVFQFKTNELSNKIKKIEIKPRNKKDL